MDLCGRAVPAVSTTQGVRAVTKDKPVESAAVERYLQSKFGEALPKVREAMSKLAKAFPPDKLAAGAFGLYERFRPSIPEGVSGWGAKGDLDLGRIAKLADEA